MRKILIIAAAIVSLASCTDNQKARHYGGEETVKISPKEKFINITWKESNLWIITQDTTTGTYYAREKSAYGIWEGKITVTK